MIPGFCPASFGVLLCSVWYSAADTHLKLLDRAVSGAWFLTGVCLSVTLLIVDLLQFFVCCVRSGVTRCTLLIVLYLDRMCQSGYHEVALSHIGILTRHLAAEPRSTVGLFPSQCPSGMILLTQCSMLWDWWVSRTGPMLFYWPISCITIVFYYFSLSLLPVYRLVLWAGVFGLIGCISLSLSLALPTS